MKNLVEPIKDKKLVEEVEKYLAKQSLRNQLIWVFGCNTGLRISDILGLNVEDVEGKCFVEIREKKTDKYKRFPLNNKLQKLIKKYLVERAKTYSVTGDNPLFVGKKHHRLDRSQVYRIINAACSEVGITNNVGCHTMRKTFAWRYYKETGDIYYLQNLLNHASPSITYRYIGEKPNVEVQLKKMTAQENERSRFVLLTDDKGKERIRDIVSVLEGISDELSNPGNNDAFYGKVDCFLVEIEEMVRNYQNTK